MRYSITKNDLDGYTTSSYVKYYSDGEMEEFRSKYGIPASFSETDIVDNIEKGLDSLENYTGYKLELLQMEFKKRANVLNYSNF